MRKKVMVLIGAMLILAIAGTITAAFINRNRKPETGENEPKIRIVTSFYPGYIIGLNLADEVAGIVVESLTDFSTGCLHDYQLTTSDMRLLLEADVFIMNGGGMESYLDDVIENYPELAIIDLSEGITMLGSLEEEGKLNAHVWLDPELYLVQIENARKGIAEYVNSRSDKELWTSSMNRINNNADAYKKEVEGLQKDYEQLLTHLKESTSQSGTGNKVVIFHDAFAYLAEKAGLEVAYAVEVEEDTALSAGVIAEVVNIIKEENIRYLFSERQYGTSISKRIEEETEAKVYIIDSAVTGEGTKDSYLDAMYQNLNTLKEAFNY